jgi:DNA-binding IclR family transcriptional regulator
MADDGGVAAVDRALSILDALTDDRVTLAELSKRTDLYKSTVLRLLKSLERFGYVLRSADGSYRLGSKVLHLGSLYQRHFRTSDIVPPVLERVAAELHEGAAFYVCEDDKRICLHRVETTRAVRDSVQVGDRLPLTVGAAGHVLRALQRRARRALRRDPPAHVRLVVRRARFRDRSDGGPRARPGQQARRRAQRLGAALPHRGGGRGSDHSGTLQARKELTRTFGGNVDDPTLMGWNQAKSRRGKAAGATKRAGGKAATGDEPA